MIICNDCKQPTSISHCFKEDGKWIEVCTECWKKREAKRIEGALETVNHPSDFRTWKMDDMSEAFWMHLARYKKKPNRKSLDVMNQAFLWACHADHGLSNSFYHALKWCGIDLHTEQGRKDLPDTDKEG